MTTAIAELPPPGRRREKPAPAGLTMPQFVAALAIMTALAVGTGFALAYTVQERVAAVQAASEAQTAGAMEPARFAGEMTLERLPPIVTNLQEPSDAWIRVDLALVMDTLEDEERQRLAAEIAADTLAYLRTLTLAQIEGASGLQFLREDLSERAATRSRGRVRELILETLVVQ